jgi:hypothetical protein
VSALNTILFYFFSTLAVASALAMITRRNVAHAAIFLVTTLLATGGIFLLLQAEFIFAVQVFLYAGGAVILFVFVIALASPQATPRLAPPSGRAKVVGAGRSGSDLIRHRGGARVVAAAGHGDRDCAAKYRSDCCRAASPIYCAI